MRGPPLIEDQGDQAQLEHLHGGPCPRLQFYHVRGLWISLISPWVVHQLSTSSGMSPCSRASERARNCTFCDWAEAFWRTFLQKTIVWHPDQSRDHTISWTFRAGPQPCTMSSWQLSPTLASLHVNHLILSIWSPHRSIPFSMCHVHVLLKKAFAAISLRWSVAEKGQPRPWIERQCSAVHRHQQAIQHVWAHGLETTAQVRKHAFWVVHV